MGLADSLQSSGKLLLPTIKAISAHMKALSPTYLLINMHLIFDILKLNLIYFLDMSSLKVWKYNQFQTWISLAAAGRNIKLKLENRFMATFFSGLKKTWFGQNQISSTDKKGVCGLEICTYVCSYVSSTNFKN